MRIRLYKRFRASFLSSKDFFLAFSQTYLLARIQGNKLFGLNNLEPQQTILQKKKYLSVLQSVFQKEHVTSYVLYV